MSGKKFDQDKPRMSLLIDGMPRALLEVGKVLTFGAQKYADHDWLNVPFAISRYKSALIRHELAKAQGQEIDPESGLSHSAHIACNALFILELDLRSRESMKEVITEAEQEAFVESMYKALDLEKQVHIYRSTR